MIKEIRWNYKWTSERPSDLIAQAGTRDYLGIKFDAGIYPIYQIVYIDLWQ